MSNPNDITLGDIFGEVQKMGRELSGLSSSSNLLFLEVRNLMARQNTTDERLSKIETMCAARSQSNDKHRKLELDKMDRIEGKLATYHTNEVTGRYKISELEKKQSAKVHALEEKVSIAYKAATIILGGLISAVTVGLLIYKTWKGF